MRRMLLCLLCVLIGCVVWAQETPPNQTVGVTIRPGDNPMQMDGVKALLATDAASRLAPLPATLSDEEYRSALLTGQFEKYAGSWPFRAPSGDPAKITKTDYLELIKRYPGIQTYIDQYGKTPVKANDTAYEAVPIFMAMYKATGDRQYLYLTQRAVEAMSLSIEAEVAKNPEKPASYAQYWVYDYAYVYLPLLEIAGTPEYTAMMTRFAQALAKRADAWPQQKNPWAAGAHLYSSVWYELALKYGPPMTHATDIRAYNEILWHSWWDYREITEDDPNYTLGDMIVLHAWCLSRGVKWWQDPDASLIWKDYGEQIGNDGTWPAYGDGGNLGRFTSGVYIGELLARYTGDGRYKWLAHRAFWNVKDRIKQLCSSIGYEKVMYLALAYLAADDRVAEVPPTAGVTVTQRHWREFVPSAERRSTAVVFTMKPQRNPSKVVFRGGSKETDCYMTVQAEQHSGHGHPNSAAISGYGGDLAYYLTYATHRMDHFMEAHNLFTLREPPYDKPWGGRWYGLEVTENVSVPVSGQSREGSYARVHVEEYPDTPATPERWTEMHQYKSIWPPIKAIGYKGWPVRLDRCVLFVNNHFSVVRDVTNWQLPVTAQIGPNWTFGELGSAGANWVNVWAPPILSGHFNYDVQVNGRSVRLAPMDSAPRDLLIWFAPRSDGALVIEKLIGDRSGIEAYAKAKHNNLPLRAWYTATGAWQPAQPQAFTTVLMPHAPGMDTAKLAGTISVELDSPGCTVLRVVDGDTVYLAVLNSGGKPLTVKGLTTDAEAALLTAVKGKLASLAAWQATLVSFNGKVLRKAALPGDVVQEMK